MLGAGASALMFFGTPERPWLFVAMFLVANLNYELVQSFYNAFLPEIADDQQHERGLGLGLRHRLRRRRLDARGRDRDRSTTASRGACRPRTTFCPGCACW